MWNQVVRVSYHCVWSGWSRLGEQFRRSWFMRHLNSACRIVLFFPIIGPVEERPAVWNDIHISTLWHADCLPGSCGKSSAEQQYWLGQCQLLADIWPVKLLLFRLSRRSFLSLLRVSPAAAISSCCASSRLEEQKIECVCCGHKVTLT
jgi:hypothetical protein